MEMERVEVAFYELLEAEGFEDWYESEDRWEDWERAMVEAGLVADVVAQFFCELAWEL